MTQTVQRDAVLNLSTTPKTIYGSSGLFALTGDRDLISLSLAGQNDFLDWIGWEGTKEYLVHRYFVDYVRPADAGGNVRSIGYLADPCGDANSVEWGRFDFQLAGFSRLRRLSPTRDATMIDVKYNANQPLYRLDGSLITNDYEFDVRITTEALMQDIKELIVTGNKTTTGQFDGLERLVKTGYTDSAGRRATSMDSIVIDMAANTMAGGASMTWNGVAIASTFNFVDILLAAFRRVMDRIKMSPTFSSRPLQVGDMVFVAPTHILRALLDRFTIWSVSPGVQYNEMNLNTYEARNFRNGLNGGMFNAGRIYLDGFEIPLMAYDWKLAKGPTLADCYLLTGRVGGVAAIQGQYNDLSSVPANYPSLMYQYTDGGRLLTWEQRDGTCARYNVEMQPRLLMLAPWAQVRFTNVKAVGPTGILSPDPWQTSFFPETSFAATKV